MNRVFTRAIKFVRGTWPVFVAGYLVYLVTGVVMMATIWAVTRMLPKIEFDLDFIFDPDRLLGLLSSYLGVIGLAFIWLTIGMTVTYVIFIFLTGGVLAVFRSYAGQGRGFDFDIFLRAGIGYLAPLLGLNMLLLALALAVIMVLSFFGLALGLAGGALTLGPEPTAGIGFLLILFLLMTACQLAVGLFFFLASGVASARLVWDDLPVLTSLRYFITGFKEHFWLHVALGIILVLLGCVVLFLVLMINVIGGVLAGTGAGTMAVKLLLQLVVFSVYTIFSLAVMTGLMEQLRPGAAISGNAL